MKTGNLCKVTSLVWLSDYNTGTEFKKLNDGEVVLIIDDTDNKWNKLCGHVFMLVLTKEGHTGIVAISSLIEI